MVFFSVAQTEILRPTEPFLFYMFAGLAAIGALWVVFSQEIVRMAVALLITLGAVAALYFLLEAEFLAAVQLIVYVGGTLILIVFGIMLTTQGPDVRFPISLSQRLLGWFIGLVAVLVMAVIGVIGVIGQQNEATAAASPGTPTRLMGPGQGREHEASVVDMGEALVSEYVVPLQIAAVLLLIVMIGAAYIAKGRHHEIEEARRAGWLDGTGSKGASN